MGKAKYGGEVGKGKGKGTVVKIALEYKEEVGQGT